MIDDVAADRAVQAGASRTASASRRSTSTAARRSATRAACSGSRAVVRWLTARARRDRGPHEPEPDGPASSRDLLGSRSSPPMPTASPDAAVPGSRSAEPVPVAPALTDADAGPVRPAAVSGYRRAVAARARVTGTPATPEGDAMPIRVDAYTAGGMASGKLGSCRARCGRPRDQPASCPSIDAAWHALDDAGRPPGRALTIPIDDILVAVDDEDPSTAVHASWHPISLGRPVRRRRRAADAARLRPGTRPDPAERRVRAAPRRPARSARRPETGVAVGCHALVNRYGVERVRADIMLGFFFPGAVMDGPDGAGTAPRAVASSRRRTRPERRAGPAPRPAAASRAGRSRRPPGGGPACDGRGARASSGRDPPASPAVAAPRCGRGRSRPRRSTGWPA